MNKDQLDETFEGIVDDKFNAVVGKMVEKDGKYVFEGVSLNKAGQVIGSITYVTGFCTLVYLGAKASVTIGEKIANKIRQRKLKKAKTEAMAQLHFDEMVDIIQKEMTKRENSNGKHFKDEESE